ncbi:MAG: cold-shock protein [Bacteroidota bacterium]
MGKSQESYNKKEVRKKKEKKRKDKEEKRNVRKESGKGNLDDMIAYVDEYGRITDTPPDPSKREAINAEDIEIGIPTREKRETPSYVRTGVVTYYNTAKGFGFIRDSQSNENVYFHVNNLKEAVREGSKVSFEITSGLKGPSAQAVSLVKPI